MTRGCYQMAAGKNATADGSVLIARSCDSFGGDDLLQIQAVPRMTHELGASIEIPATQGIRLPQIPTTNAYVSVIEVTEGKDIDAVQGGVNEYQVSAGSSSGGAFNEKAANVCPIIPSSIGQYRMTLVLERCKTAREGIQLIGELTDKYGARFDNFLIADPNEAWLYEEYQGYLWAAVRVPDDCFIIEANTFRINFVDYDNPANFLGSKNLIPYATEHGLYEPSSGEAFSPAAAFYEQPETRGYNRLRLWRGISCLAPSTNLDPEAPSGTYPLFVKPERKLTPKDFIALYCDHYQGTKYDYYGMNSHNYKPKTSPIIADDPSKTVKESPLHLNLERQYQLAPVWGPERIIGTSKAITTWTAQLSRGLPSEIGGVIWAGIGEGATTPHMPFYAGITRTPEPFCIGTRKIIIEEGKIDPTYYNHYDERSAYWIFRVVTNLVNLFYTATKDEVIPKWRKWEEMLYKQQPKIEKVALELYNQDPELAIDFLTNYSCNKASEALTMAKKMTGWLHTLISHYNA